MPSTASPPPADLTLTIPSGARGEPVALGNALYSYPVPVRWADLDADGRVNNTVILRYCEEARMQWLLALGLSGPGMDRFPVLAAVSCQYASAIRHPATVAVDVYCPRVGRTSMDVVFHVRTADASQTHAVARIAWVWVDSRDERPVEVPTALRQAALPD